MGTVHMFPPAPPGHPDPSRTPDPNPGSRPPCEHAGFDVAGVHGDVCGEDGSVRWTDVDGEVDGMEAVGRLFGSFRLAGRLEAVAAPGPQVFVYVPRPGRVRSRLAPLPRDRWMEVASDLWAMSDGSALLLSPTDPLLAANLAR